MTAWSCYDCPAEGTGEQGAMNRAAEKHVKTEGHSTAVYEDDRHTRRDA